MTQLYFRKRTALLLGSTLCTIVSLAQVPVRVSDIREQGAMLASDIAQGNYSKVQAVFDKHIADKTRTVDGHSALGYMYDRISEDETIIAALNRWCSQGDASHSAYLLRGEWYTDEAWRRRGSGWASQVTEEGWILFRENLAKARSDLEKAYEMNPAAPHAASGMITVCMGQSRSYPEHRSWFRRAIAADQEFMSPYYRMVLAMAPKWGGSTDMVLNFIDNAMAQHPDNPVFGSLRLNWLYEKKDDELKLPDSPEYREAHGLALRYAEGYPKSSCGQHYLGRLLWRQTRNQDALEYMSKAIALDPTSNRYFQRGKMKYSLEQYEAARHDFEEAIALNPNAFSPRFYLGKIEQFSSKNYAAAIDCYNKALDLQPRSTSTLSRRGYCFYKLKKYEAAKSDYEYVLTIDPNDSRDWYCLGKTEEHGFRNYSAAIECYTKALNIKPDSDAFLARIGYCYYKLKDYDAARTAFESALAIDQNDASDWYDLGTVEWYGYGNAQRALECFAKSLDICSHVAEPFYQRGEVFRGIEEYNKAVVEYSKYLTMKPDQTDALYGRGVAYWEKGLFPEARADFARAVEKAPSLTKKVAAYVNAE